MKSSLVKPILALLLCFPFIMAGQGIADEESYAFRNTNLSTEERIDDLVNRLRLEEKTGQMRNC